MDVIEKIPRDIDLIATEIVRKRPSDDDDPEWVLYKDIANAILAERERCAEIAEHLNGWGADNGRNGVAEYIAKIIRERP